MSDNHDPLNLTRPPYGGSVSVISTAFVLFFNVVVAIVPWSGNMKHNPAALRWSLDALFAVIGISIYFGMRFRTIRFIHAVDQLNSYSIWFHTVEERRDHFMCFRDGDGEWAAAMMRVQDAVSEWCRENARGRWRVEVDRVRFARKSDLAMFMLFRSEVVALPQNHPVA